jgi:hypothetical protein
MEAEAFLIEWLSFLRPLGKSSYWVPLFLLGLNVQLGDLRGHHLHFITTLYDAFLEGQSIHKPFPGALSILTHFSEEDLDFSSQRELMV